MTHLLDNPVWSALNTGNKNMAQGTDTIKFYHTAIAPFAGMAEYSPENLLALHALTPDEGEGVFTLETTTKIEIPSPWTVLFCVPAVQMVCEDPIFRTPFTAPLIDLTEEHIPQMLALTQLTKPGPFRQRTIEYGHYQGIFDGEKLVAMAGQRMYAPPYAEVSAVCTHPNYTGRGYAAQLMLSQMKRMREAGEIPFLHAAQSNERAVKIYESLGFKVRREEFFSFIKK